MKHGCSYNNEPVVTFFVFCFWGHIWSSVWQTSCGSTVLFIYDFKNPMNYEVVNYMSQFKQKLAAWTCLKISSSSFFLTSELQ